MAERPPRAPWLPAEILAARREDPDFAEVMGRARAKARGEEYDPDKHHPDRPFLSPESKLDPEKISSLYEIIDRWMDRGTRPNRYLPPPLTERRHLKAL